MQKLGLDEDSNEAAEPKKDFWRRQFQTESTQSQKIFDWALGVILPVVCFVFDPIVFKGNAWGVAIFAQYKPFAYLLSFVSIMAMAAWLVWGAKLKWLNAFLAGLFAVGAFVSLIVGIWLTPISLLGLIVLLVGALGFTPLFSSIVYLRNAVRAFRAAKPFLENKVLVRAFVLSAIFSAVVPSVVNLEIKRSLDKMSNGDAQAIRAEGRRLRFVAPLVNFDVLARSYHGSKFGADKERKETAAEIFRELTGEDIETKTRVLMD